MSWDKEYLKLALEEARKCEPTATAYCVGCIIVEPVSNRIVATGFSRELPGNTHAEECALRKLLQTKTTEDGLDMYVSMEPCSERLSGNKPCADRIVEAGRLIKRVILGVREPDEFVKCVGVDTLQEHGIIVLRNDDEELERECLEVARRGHAEHAFGSCSKLP